MYVEHILVQCILYISQGAYFQNYYLCFGKQKSIIRHLKTYFIILFDTSYTKIHLVFPIHREKNPKEV